MTHTLTLPIGHDGHALHAAIEPAPRGGYHATWLLFDGDSNIVTESPGLPMWYMDYCPNEIVTALHMNAWQILGIDGDADALAQRHTCTCDDE